MLDGPFVFCRVVLVNSEHDLGLHPSPGASTISTCCFSARVCFSGRSGSVTSRTASLTPVSVFVLTRDFEEMPLSYRCGCSMESFRSKAAIPGDDLLQGACTQIDHGENSPS